MDVQVVIDGILLYCDESASLLTLGNGYTIQKTKVDDLPYRSHIVDGNGRLSINYMGSRIIDGEDVYFMCIHKTILIKSNLRKSSWGLLSLIEI